MGSAIWYVGFAIVFVLVWVVVILVATILSLARRIAVQAREVSVALHATGSNTDVLQAIAGVNRQIVTVYNSVSAVRTRLLEGGQPR